MTTEKRKYGEQLQRLRARMAEAVDNLSEVQLIQECRDAGEDPDAELARIDSILDSAKRSAGKRRLLRARQALDHHRKVATPSALIPTEPAARRSYLKRRVAASPEFGQRLSLAARNNKSSLENMSDNDVTRLLEAAAALGITLPDDSGK